jgi:hypothetical protein
MKSLSPHPDGRVLRCDSQRCGTPARHPSSHRAFPYLINFFKVQTIATVHIKNSFSNPNPLFVIDGSRSRRAKMGFQKRNITYIVRRGRNYSRVLSTGTWGRCTCLQAVLRIRGISVRILIRGSVPLTNGSGSCYFRQ